MHECMNAYERLAGLTPRKLHGVYVCPSRTRTRQGCTAVVHYHSRYTHTYIHIHTCMHTVHTLTELACRFFSYVALR